LPPNTLSSPTSLAASKRQLNSKNAKRRRGKRLNLLGEEVSGPQFFSPSRVQAARDYQAIKEAEKQLELDAKAEKKVKTEAIRLQKEKEKAQRAIERVERQHLAAEEKARKAAERQALQELKAVAKAAKIAPRKLKETSTLAKASRKRNISTISPTIDLLPVKKQKVVVSITTRGRAVLRPQRFDS
jgi:alanyl-tRNA synthetase